MSQNMSNIKAIELSIHASLFVTSKNLVAYLMGSYKDEYRRGDIVILRGIYYTVGVLIEYDPHKGWMMILRDKRWKQKFLASTPV